MSNLVTIKKPSDCTNTPDMCTASIQAIQDVMHVLGGKWKISIMTCLRYSPRKFNELLRIVEGISGKVLSRELKDLEMNQLITRTVMDTQPVTVQYAITPYGNSLKELTEVMAAWGIKHRKKLAGRI